MTDHEEAVVAYLKSIDVSLRHLVKMSQILVQKVDLPPVEPPPPLEIPRSRTTW